ncbi:GNAT family N-acetyltransferase [Massilia sp. LXY-6]|uniref:GNAT family N-acetyltransferase n=1 Tax=Massilia sp. LXY-6 TaxID=3379823 RepID=UPI003EE40ADE
MSWTLVPASQFGAYASHWTELHAAGAASPLLAGDFVAPLLAECASGSELLACYRHAGRTEAMTVVVPQGRAGWTTFQPPQAPIGLWLQRPGLDRAALASALLRRLPGYPLVLGLLECDPLLAPRPSDGGNAATLDYIDTACITLAGSFDGYWEARGKNLRANLKKQRARLARECIATRLEVVRTPQEVAAAVADYGRLESTGWKGQQGTAVHASNEQGRFYRAMLEAFCARGAGSIYRYWFGERLVAMDLCVENGEQIVILKTAYDETVPASLSPALLMREEQVRQLFDEQRLARIEFYGRVMEWHQRWTSEMRTLYHINFYRWPALRRLHATLQSRRAAAPVPHTTE